MAQLRRWHRFEAGLVSASCSRSGPLMRARALLPIIAASALGGCASVHPVPTTVATTGMPNPEAALQQTISHVDAEMAELGQYRSSTAAVSSPPVPEDLQRIVSFKWSGPLDQGVAKLALSVGYTFYVTAPPNAAPLDVSVNVENAPAFRAFQALGEEAGTRATVEVDPLHHAVQVIHHA